MGNAALTIKTNFCLPLVPVYLDFDIFYQLKSLPKNCNANMNYVNCRKTPNLTFICNPYLTFWHLLAESQQLKHQKNM